MLFITLSMYITMKSLDDKNIDSANSLYLIFNNVDERIECNSTRESNEDKYLIFASTDKSNIWKRNILGKVYRTLR